MEIYFNNKPYAVISGQLIGRTLKDEIYQQLGLDSEIYYLLNNGKLIEDCNVITSGTIHIIPKVLGGKGGFGSMLRAIGAQIEKTTNREACRDLSGRRLRDINEEQRLKNWINQQAEREKEAKERKKKKLERLCEKPRHEFQDAEYDKERSELPEKVEDAVLQGLQASCSTKRKILDKTETVSKKKPKLWVDDELDEDLSCSGDESESDLDDNGQSGDSKKTSEMENSKSLAYIDLPNTENGGSSKQIVDSEKALRSENIEENILEKDGQKEKLIDSIENIQPSTKKDVINSL